MPAGYLASSYKVRFNDCDPFRHLNNARYLDYFLNAREDHLRDHYQMDLADSYRKNQGWVVHRHEIIYLRPASLHETICIQSALLDAGPHHLRVEMLMLDKDQKHLKALLHSQFVPISLATGRKEAHNPKFMDFISDKLVTGPGPIHAPAGQRAQFWQEQIKMGSGVENEN